ncbi:MAG: hypothetical protein QMB90_10495 [Rubritalea sp.]
MTKNIFQLYSEIKQLPFAASRRNWKDSDLIIVTRVEPKGDYGKVYGFSVHDGVPNDHVAYSSWKKDMGLPNVGSYQWRLIDLPQGTLIELVDRFYRGVGKQYGFIEPVEEFHSEETLMDEWLEEEK